MSVWLSVFLYSLHLSRHVCVMSKRVNILRWFGIASRWSALHVDNRPAMSGTRGLCIHLQHTEHSITTTIAATIQHGSAGVFGTLSAQREQKENCQKCQDCWIHVYMFSVNGAITAGGKMRMCASADVRTCKMQMLMQEKIRILPTQAPYFRAATYAMHFFQFIRSANRKIWSSLTFIIVMTYMLVKIVTIVVTTPVLILQWLVIGQALGNKV